MWISAGRDENFRIKEQTLTSSRRIAGAVTYHTVNENNPPLTMQMDPTTLQLIQVLERTVSSGKCIGIVPSWRRYGGPAGRFLSFRRLLEISFDRKRDADAMLGATATVAATAAARAMASSIWST